MVVFSFSRAGGRDAQQWIQLIMRDDPHLAIYTVIFLDSVPELFRAMAISGIKHGLPPALQDRTILLYRDGGLWRHRLQVSNERQACVMLVGLTGRIRWMTSGPFADSLGSELSRSIRTLK